MFPYEVSQLHSIVLANPLYLPIWLSSRLSILVVCVLINTKTMGVQMASILANRWPYYALVAAGFCVDVANVRYIQPRTWCVVPLSCFGLIHPSSEK